MNKFVIVGGGTAGWLTALFVNKFVPYSDVTVIASSKIGILGAGEGTTPHFIDLLKDLDIPISDIFEHAQGTKKTGIRFTNWNGDGKHYDHPFWDNKYALHFNARSLAKYFEKIAIERGVRLIDDEVNGFNTNEKGYVTSIKITDSEVPCNFVFDCSGFKRLIIGGLYGEKWNAYSDSLPCKRAMPFFVDHDGDIPEYTEAIAMKYGWVWRIPVQGRYGCGYVFDSDYITDEQAKQEVEEYFGHEINPPTIFTFSAGSYNETWIKNCIAIGLSSAFTEPLEATSIWIQISSLRCFADHMPQFSRGNEFYIKDYNKAVQDMNVDIKNFLHMHYLTKRTDSPFWTEFRQKNKTPEFVNQVKSIVKKQPLTNYDLDYLYKLNDNKHGISTYYSNSWNAIVDGIKFNES